MTWYTCSSVPRPYFQFVEPGSRIAIAWAWSWRCNNIPPGKSSSQARVLEQLTFFKVEGHCEGNSVPCPRPIDGLVQVTCTDDIYKWHVLCDGVVQVTCTGDGVVQVTCTCTCDGMVQVTCTDEMTCTSDMYMYMWWCGTGDMYRWWCGTGGTCTCTCDGMVQVTFGGLDFLFLLKW
jgi:uncharacterized protein YndB with AHSA1/START domain